MPTIEQTPCTNHGNFSHPSPAIYGRFVKRCGNCGRLLDEHNELVDEVG